VTSKNAFRKKDLSQKQYNVVITYFGPLVVYCRKKDSDDLTPDDRFRVTTEEFGNTKLVIQNVQLSDAGVYFCVAENAKGRVKCAATLRVNGQ